jgi:phosphoadenosine phosphosulfate reductase
MQELSHIKFHVLRTQRDLAIHGAPVDVVPIKYTVLGNIFQGTDIKYQSYLDCCSRSIWVPMNHATRTLGATVVYRGQRDEDAHKAPLIDGQVIDGIEYRFPLQKWSRRDVRDYLRSQCPDLIPSYYTSEKTSRDCMDCTAYLSDNRARLQNLEEPMLSKVHNTLDTWVKDVTDEVKW